MIENIWKDFRRIKNYTWVIVFTVLTAVLGYGYQVMHPTIGMDDTVIEKYFIGGWAPQVGRWTLYLLNKVFFMAKFTPYFMDVIGVLLLICAAFAFCVLFFRVSAGKLRTIAYIMFGAVFISSPFMGEVYIYYLHNGVGFSFLMIAFSALCLWECTEKKNWWALPVGSIALSLAVGCYESFALVYIAVVTAVYIVSRVYRNEKKGAKIYWRNVGLYCVPLITALILRSVVSGIIVKCLGLEMSARSASSMKFWFMNDAWVILKDLLYKLYMRYVLNGEYLFEVKMYAITIIIFILYILYRIIKNKSISILGYGVLMAFVPWLLVGVELAVTPYRASQTLVFFIALVWMLVIDLITSFELKTTFKKITTAIAILLFMVIVFNQGFQLNKYFYFDTLKNNNDERVCTEIAYQIMRECDTTKPVVFVGGYEMPEPLRDWVYLPVGSEEYNKLGNSMNLSNTLAFYTYVDNNYGYMFYEIGSQDPLNWMTWAATGETSQVYVYMEMLGFKFVRAPKDMCEEATSYAADFPIWPVEGSIKECDKYIIVKLGR